MRKILCILPLFVLFACNNNVVFSEYKSIPADDGWAVKNKLSFETNIEDTTSLHDVFVIVRNDDSYPFRNLLMFVETRYPDGNVKKDTIDCQLADDKGRWLGDGAGDLWDNTIPFKHNVRFPRKGKYTFTFEQAMRFGDKESIDPLPLILDVGITIEKQKK